MRFTRLRLNGFKSFVDPTDLVIAEGLTGVVGPNGCGKSNLLEALRWVMGENRPTAMRGGGMEDVIFAGAASRPARNFAEVSLSIENAERLAPAAFNEHDMIEIVRRITRDAGSAYKAAGRDVRARDVQMLFADASTGAQSPALVRQGQISEIINSKPKARRRILEDAAGIAGLYQRRHEAELKLKGAEQNLSRVDDLIEQLAQQLTQLARQAKQAGRYREIGARLREAEGLLLYRRWREADQARASADAALGDRVTAASAAEREAVGTSRARETAEAALPQLREEEAIAAAIVQRLTVEKGGLEQKVARAAEEVRRLTGRLTQLAKDADREEVLNADAEGTLQALTAEAGELRTAGQGHDEAISAAEAEADEATRILGDREGAHQAMTEDVARLAARHQSVRRLVEDGRAARDRATRLAADARGASETAAAALSDAEDRAAAATRESDGAEGLIAAAEAELQAAESARAAAQKAESEARGARSAADGELGALRAEHGALQKLVARADDDGAALMDRLSVTSGYETALGAALADDLQAPVSDRGSGWRTLPAYAAPPDLPAAADPLISHVQNADPLARRLSQVGLVPADQGPELQRHLAPGQRLVSRDGHLWRWDGLVRLPEDVPSAAALRLQQMNRLTALGVDLADAESRAEDARTAHAAAESRLADLDRADAAARQARRAADQRVAMLGRAQSQAEADRTLAAGRLETARKAADRHAQEAQEAEARLTEAETAMRDLDDLDAHRAEVADTKLTVDAARMTMMAKRAALDELRRAGETRAARLAAIARESAGWQKRLDSAGGRLDEIAGRRARTERDLAAAEAVPADLADRQAKVADGLETAETRRRDAADALSEGETAAREAAQAERAAERAAGEAREARAAAAAQADAAREATAAAAERIEEALETTPDRLLQALGADPDRIPPAEEIEAEITTLKRQRESLGAVNLRAEADAEDVQSEYDSLSAEKADLDGAIAELRRGIAGLNREGRERLLTAFEQVNANFAMLFAHLFGGGEARLELVESDDPLDAGLEILCCPPGKRLSTLSLLSGGEQTLTALALIFAVFLANPAPICVLDEVDAPLDDANVTRFCDMLDEMTRQTETRFLIITHHAVTMARMDRLFGVTMGEQGVSQLVSVDLKRAEAMVA